VEFRFQSSSRTGRYRAARLHIHPAPCRSPSGRASDQNADIFQDERIRDGAVFHESGQKRAAIVTRIWGIGGASMANSAPPIARQLRCGPLMHGNKRAGRRRSDRILARVRRNWRRPDRVRVRRHSAADGSRPRGIGDHRTAAANIDPAFPFRLDAPVLSRNCESSASVMAAGRRSCASNDVHAGGLRSAKSSAKAPPELAQIDFFPGQRGRTAGGGGISPA